MSKYRVQTGAMDVTVEAKNHRMAAIKAIDENNPKSLGLIVAILKEGDSIDDELFMKSEFILECMDYKFSDNAFASGSGKVMATYRFPNGNVAVAGSFVMYDRISKLSQQ